MTTERSLELAAEGFMTPKEAATHLRICQTLIYRAMASGELLSTKVGRSRRIPRRAVTEYAANLLAAGQEKKVS